MGILPTRKQGNFMQKDPEGEGLQKNEEEFPGTRKIAEFEFFVGRDRQTEAEMREERNNFTEN